LPDFLAGPELLHHQIAHRRPSSGQDDPTGEFPVRPDLFPRLAVRRSAVSPWSLAGAAMAVVVLTTTPCVACWWASGPSSQWAWVISNPMQRVFRICFISRNFRTMLKLVKCIEKYLLVGKMRMTYQNAQKNMLYMFMLNSCIFIQL
jgi:hypothetical protein